MLHAPRYRGKTSCLLALRDYMNARGEFYAVYANVEAGQASRNQKDEENMYKDVTYTYDIKGVFTSWYGALCYFAFRYVQDDEMARDIVQEVFVRLMEKKLSFESELHLKNFMYRTVKNDCLNCLRQKFSREHYLEYLRQEGEEEEFDCRMIESEIIRILKKAVERLPQECRKVFELCYFEGMGNEKAAKTLNISVETVKAQKKRGKKILRKKLDGLYPLFILLFGL